jgi:hypothetical protein
LRERLDKEDKKLVKRGQEPTGDSLEFTGAVREVDVGEYQFEDFDPKAIKGKGTLILADDLHPTFTKTFAESRKFEKFVDPSLEWEECLGILSKVHSLQELGDYWRLLWELAAACPVPYVSDTALPKGLIRQEQKRLASYDFRLIADGIEFGQAAFEALDRDLDGFGGRELLEA